MPFLLRTLCDLVCPMILVELSFCKFDGSKCGSAEMNKQKLSVLIVSSILILEVSLVVLHQNSHPCIHMYVGIV